MVQANSKEFPYENYYFGWQESWEESQVKETAFHSKDWAQQILEGDRKNQPIVAATSSKERQFDLAAQFLPFSHLRMIAPIFRYLMFQTMNGSRFLFQSVADGVRELPWFLHLTSLPYDTLLKFCCSTQHIFIIFAKQFLHLQGLFFTPNR